MSTEAVDNWLSSGRRALIDKISLKPIEHSLRKGKPLSSKKGQAEVFFLAEVKGSWWILKKFHGNCRLDSQYLEAISTLLPKESGFLCGTNRRVLGRGALWHAQGHYYNNDLDCWLDGTILMPQITGLDWAGLADKIRDNNIILHPNHRFTICRNLTRLIEMLEDRQCCHRDLSCGNVFIDPITLEVFLIDFDSLYHPSLSIPDATTCGTMGYTAHQAWNQGQLDPSRTWCPYVDRYALSLLNAEILLVEYGTDTTNDGGIFDQDELKSQRGKGLNSILKRMRKRYPTAAQLLKSTIRSTSFAKCPSPEQWHQYIDTQIGPVVKPPKLCDIAEIDFTKRVSQLAQQRQTIPLWPVPSLAQLPKVELHIPRNNLQKMTSISLPPNPWSKKP